MPELKGSKTEANLWTAFAGESQARNKYTYFASKAKKDGYVQISKIFEETAANEKEHAEIWFKLLEGIGTTAENLKAAAEGDKWIAATVDAFHYQIGKEVGAMAAVMKGKVDQIILTGGIAYGQETVDAITDMVGWIAPITVYPGEDELLALAQGALRVLNGEEPARVY